MLNRIASLITGMTRTTGITGAAALGLAFGVKAFYSHAGADELLWVLAPSAWLARVVGGVDLVYEQGAGFISHAHRLVVGPACAGVNFLVICFLCLYFSFAQRFASRAQWFICSLLIAFAGTVAANGLRICVSAYLWNADIYGGSMTPELVHRLAGVAIYYASLLTLYFVVESGIGTRAPRSTPLLWYVGISLGVPLAGRLVAGGTPGLARHAAWVAGVAGMLTLVAALPAALRNRIHCRP
jgi:exosortase K